MPIFQKSVLQKHLKNLDKSIVDIAYKKFKENYSPEKINQIQQLKEEEYQDGFLRDIFVDVLGYTLKPDENYNLVREFKNQTDGKKADGAIVKNGNAIAVIELKSTKTKDLTKIMQQAFNYKNNQPECKYVITSNFQKLRFYIDYANEYEEFDLFHLTREQFDVFYLILNKDSIFNNLPLQLKEETIFHEQKISDNLYKDYSAFKRKLFENLVKNNPEIDKLTLFKKSQKLIDRFLFILFAEDSGLLPPNSIARIIKRYNILKEEDAYKPLYDIFKQYFGYMNIGRKGKTPADDIPAYNGGLFYPDEILDNLIIDDEILIDDLLHLSEYDFNTEVDVNILGHIFEHSLTEIEEITAELQGTATDKTKSKRKKDGVFYTPKYITRYIVENTVGKLCQEKRQELDIEEIEFDGSYKTKSGKLSAKGKALAKKLHEYKTWLLQLKIIDPACGSGAFLNQALNFLIDEHRNIDDILTELTGELPFHQVDKSILENNLYGVDINEESVEIAKLSLWLRTARKGRKLSNLNNNIKCGNSLIDDPEVAGDKAFDWHKEFPEIMQNGGFDVVIGNPPYVRIQGLKAHYEKESHYYEEHYQSATANYDIYVLFMEKAFQLIHEKGVVSFILPHKFLISDFGKGIRKFLWEHRALEELLHFGSHMVFTDASTYTCIIKLSHHNNEIKFKHISPEQIGLITDFDTISYDELTDDKWNLISNEIKQVLNKLNQQPLRVKNVFKKIFTGIQTSADKIYLIKGEEKENFIVGYSQQLDKMVSLEKEMLKPMLKGEDIAKYKYLENKYWVIFPYLIREGKAIPMSENFIRQNYPNTYAYLKENEAFLRGRERGRMDKEGWFLYIYPKSLNECNRRDKIVAPDILHKMNLSYDAKGFCVKNGAYGVVVKNEFVPYTKSFLAILNSNLMWFFLKSTGTELRGGYFRFNTNYIMPFPLPEIKRIKEQPFIEKADLMLELNKQLQAKKKKFLNRVQEHFALGKVSKKMDAFYNYEFKTFVAELRKKKIKLSLLQQDEWEDYFTAYKNEINRLQALIHQTDKEIDRMVYELYELTTDEIRIVEENI